MSIPASEPQTSAPFEDHRRTFYAKYPRWRPVLRPDFWVAVVLSAVVLGSLAKALWDWYLIGGPP